MNELYALVEKLQDKVDNEMNASRFDIEIEVLQQKNSDLQARLNDVELQKPDSKFEVETFLETASQDF